MESLLKLYKSFTGSEPITYEKISGGGSNRQYFRLYDEHGKTMIGAVGTSFEENTAFIYLTKHFATNGISVPQILAVSSDGMSYLQSDLGDTSLYDAIKKGRESKEGYSVDEITLLEKTIRLLPQIQVHGAVDLDFCQCYPQESINEQNVMFDLNYFKYCFLKTTGIDFNEVKLEECFVRMAKSLCSCSSQYFMYRDFQARNVMMVANQTPYFIDYQGGRRGPLQYDLVSFLWQSSSHFNSEIREHLIDVYISALKQHIEVKTDEFKESLPQWVLFRILQVLGAYGFRGKYEKKKYFLNSIPAAIDNLREILNYPTACPYPYLYELLKEMVNLPEFHVNTDETKEFHTTKCQSNGQLKVRIFSFSYKKGIPEDISGNGGGYVFDCRGTHNPGRYHQYKTLTGLDKPVIEFLENDGEITEFLKSVYVLADAHVTRYMERGFTSLMFCFGCTGGQHRSVFSAQHLAHYINDKYGIEVSVSHREQKIEALLPPRRKALIFAAGLGTRLKPLTNNMPKGLVKISDKPLIEHVLQKLVCAGFNDIVVNIHHFGDMIEAWGAEISKTDFFKKNNVRLSFSDERKELLETGGGIVFAGTKLREKNPEQKFLVHNVDILSNINLERLWEYANNDSDAVLVVSRRNTARYLIFDKELRLVGWTNIKTGEIKSPYQIVHEELSVSDLTSLKTKNYKLMAFAGIHCINNSLLTEMSTWPSKFSITDFYIDMCDKYIFKAYEPENLKIIDVGKIDSLMLAENFILENQE